MVAMDPRILATRVIEDDRPANRTIVDAFS